MSDFVYGKTFQTKNLNNFFFNTIQTIYMYFKKKHYIYEDLIIKKNTINICHKKQLLIPLTTIYFKRMSK
jgi:hypothetical protein